MMQSPGLCGIPAKSSSWHVWSPLLHVTAVVFVIYSKVHSPDLWMVSYNFFRNPSKRGDWTHLVHILRPLSMAFTRSVCTSADVCRPVEMLREIFDAKGVGLVIRYMIEQGLDMLFITCNGCRSQFLKKKGKEYFVYIHYTLPLTSSMCSSNDGAESTKPRLPFSDQISPLSSRMIVFFVVFAQIRLNTVEPSRGLVNSKLASFKCCPDFIWQGLHGKNIHCS